MNNIRIGLILDADIRVGSFTRFTAEDCYGKRCLTKVKLKSNYFDTLAKNTIHPLKFIYAENINDKEFKLIDDFGHGIISTKDFIVDNDILLKEATFRVCPAPKALL